MAAALAENVQERPERALPLLRRAYKAAREQRDNQHTAKAGFNLAIQTPNWYTLALQEVDLQGGYPKPSELLPALCAADAACVRCKQLLPKALWFTLGPAQSMAARMGEPLQLMGELQGDSLRTPPGPARASAEQRVMAALLRSSAAEQAASQAEPSLDQLITCSGCKSITATLRKCAACKQAQYCR